MTIEPIDDNRKLISNRLVKFVWKVFGPYPIPQNKKELKIKKNLLLLLLFII